MLFTFFSFSTRSIGTDITRITLSYCMHTYTNMSKMSSFFTYHETIKLTEKYIEYNMCSSLRYKIYSKCFSLRYIKSYAEVHACVNVKCPIISSVLTKSK
jgi:phosphate starvation-inducible membrane PsiE